jgi:hypothetical protein
MILLGPKKKKTADEVIQIPSPVKTYSQAKLMTAGKTCLVHNDGQGETQISNLSENTLVLRRNSKNGSTHDAKLGT